jgi:predicted phosphoribosyltransferase
VPFKDRLDAGRKLAAALVKYKDQQPVVLALPRGGVPVAAEVASALNAPLDLVLVRKIGVPDEPELAMGAVVDGGTPIVVRNEDVIRLAGIDEADFKAVCDRELAEIERRRQRYLGSRARGPACQPHAQPEESCPCDPRGALGKSGCHAQGG